MAVILVTAGFAWVALAAFNLLRGDELGGGTAKLKPVKLAGAEKTVFSWRRDACERWDNPDVPARAFRTRDGSVRLIASDYVNRAMTGPDLNRVNHSCRLIMGSTRSALPQRFADREWIASPYTLDGKTVFALVHEEYRGNEHRAGRCLSGQLSRCWYNAVTLARSNNGGATFAHARRPPAQLVATLPYRYEPDAGSYGVFNPSNIVRKDGYYYAMVLVQKFRRQRAGTCVMRTRDLADPASWRAWDGDGYNVTFVDPYRREAAASGNHFCAPVSTNQISTMVSSLTYNTYFGKYLLVGMASAYSPRERRTVHGFYYSLSDDLVDWTQRKLLRETELLWTFRCGDTDPVLYPSLLDPESDTRNFETTGRRPFLYFTRFHYFACRPTPNRDLVRVPVEFSK